MATAPDRGGGGDPIGPLLLKLRRRDAVSDREAQVLRDAIESTDHRGAGETLVQAGDPLTHSCLLLEGVVARFKHLSGGHRQITDLHVPGDFIDMHGFLLKRLEHHIGSLTPVRLAYAPHARVKVITEDEPHLARLLWLGTLMDAAMQREHMLSIGRRSGIARVAHLACELHARLKIVGLAQSGRYRVPITQVDIADATGLTSVHVNRMLRALRDRQIMTFRSGKIEIHDLPALEAIAEFDQSYLFLTPEPR